MPDKEKIKRVLVGESGNIAEITEEDRSPDTEDAKHSRSLMEHAARQYCPLGADYLGFAVVFYYSKTSLPSNPQFFTACQTSVVNVPEQFADVGHKQLRTALMSAYGRSQPKRRGN